MLHDDPTANEEPVDEEIEAEAKDAGAEIRGVIDERSD